VRSDDDPNAIWARLPKTETTSFGQEGVTLKFFYFFSLSFLVFFLFSRIYRNKKQYRDGFGMSDGEVLRYKREVEEKTRVSGSLSTCVSRIGRASASASCQWRAGREGN
jgi:hypothetical protein